MSDQVIMLSPSTLRPEPLIFIKEGASSEYHDKSYVAWDAWTGNS